MMKFYKEGNGDYLVVDTGNSGDFIEARTTAIAGQINSVNTTLVHKEFLKECEQVARASVPEKWLKILI